MEIRSEIKGKVTIVHVIGKLDSTTSQAAEEEIMKYAAANCCIVMDMSGCGYISSAGLRLLLSIGKQVKANGGQWAFAGLSEEVADVINVTGFSNFFKIFPKIEDAIKSVENKNAAH
ncbi:MAG: anti-sigma factor antagonist [Candidatus Omnitrophica bacterium]|nr:anti-sigma factor antagonist [Candidatus Omnitrophota bacterium]